MACFPDLKWQGCEAVHSPPTNAAGTGHNEDRWPDVAPAARVVRVLSESAGARKRAASMVVRIVLAAVA
jgi:hypothetical protein